MVGSDQHIDPTARRAAARLIREFGDGVITNDQFVDQWPKSPDPALDEISQRLWFTYDDLREHKLAGRFALKPEAHEYYRRCAMFLDLDRPYPWPRLRPNVWSRALLVIGTLGIWCILARIFDLNRTADGDYYPFRSLDDWMSARAEVGEQ